MQRTRSRATILCTENGISHNFRSPALNILLKGNQISEPARPEQDEAWELLASSAKYLTSDADTAGMQVAKLPPALFPSEDL